MGKITFGLERNFCIFAIMNEKELRISGLIGSRIKKVDPGAEVILFGSHARGRAHEESDWDVLILVRKPGRSRSIEKEYRDVLFELELEIGEPISVFVFAKKEWETQYIHTPLYKSVKEEGIPIS
jgi:uncharacterized protein